MFGSSKTRKRSFKYKVTVKGVTISKHYTKKAASQKAKGIYTAKVSKIGAKKYKRKRTSKRRY